MATRAQLEAALKAADAAGNTEDATALAKSLSEAPAETPSINALRSQMLPDFIAKPMNYGDDFLRRFVGGASLGGMDRLVGAATPGGYEKQKTQSNDAKENLGPVVSTTADIAGMLAPGGLLSRGAGALTGMRSLTAGETAIREGLAGGTMGGIQEANDGGDTGDIAAGTGLGMLGGSGGGILSANIGNLINRGARALGIRSNVVADTVVPPRTRAEMRQDTSNAYDAVDNMGVRYDPNSYQAMTNRLDAALQNAGIDPVLHPRAVATSANIRTSPVGPVTPRSLDTLRQVVGRDVTGTRGEDYMANIMRDHLDDFIDTGTTTTGTGTAAQAGEALRSARDLSRRGRVLEAVDEARYRGDNSRNGQGDVNALRGILNNPRRRRGMSDEETGAMERVVRGSTAENLLRDGPLQAFSPLTAGLAVTGATSNPLLGIGAGAAVAGAKPLARRAARGYTDRNIDELTNILAGGSTTPSAARGILSRMATPGAVEMTEEDRKALRKARRGY